VAIPGNQISEFKETRKTTAAPSRRVSVVRRFFNCSGRKDLSYLEMARRPQAFWSCVSAAWPALLQSYFDVPRLETNGSGTDSKVTRPWRSEKKLQCELYQPRRFSLQNLIESGRADIAIG